jgi:PAS domain S-box-containing protein
MGGHPFWAAWIVVRRAEIDRTLAGRLGAVPVDPATPEAEALRRFRSFATSALRRGVGGAPALDGLRVEPQRAAALLEGWCESASLVAATRGAELRGLLEPLAAQFRTALLGTTVARRASRAPRTKRRAVTAAIDRVADAFLAVDVDTGSVIDANPAAAVLLGLTREALLGREASGFVEADARERWTHRLEGLAESPEPCRFRVAWVDVRRQAIPVEVTATRSATRARTLALVVARPLAEGAAAAS